MKHRLNVIILFELVNQLQHLGSLRFRQRRWRSADVLMLSGQRR